MDRTNNPSRTRVPLRYDWPQYIDGLLKIDLFKIKTNKQDDSSLLNYSQIKIKKEKKIYKLLITRFLRSFIIKHYCLIAKNKKKSYPFRNSIEPLL